MKFMVMVKIPGIALSRVEYFEEGRHRRNKLDILPLKFHKSRQVGQSVLLIILLVPSIEQLEPEA